MYIAVLFFLDRRGDTCDVIVLEPTIGQLIAKTDRVRDAAERNDFRFLSSVSGNLDENEADSVDFLEYWPENGKLYH